MVAAVGTAVEVFEVAFVGRCPASAFAMVVVAGKVVPAATVAVVEFETVLGIAGTVAVVEIVVSELCLEA